jgi:hypothetical protein
MLDQPACPGLLLPGRAPASMEMLEHHQSSQRPICARSEALTIRPLTGRRDRLPMAGSRVDRWREEVVGDVAIALLRATCGRQMRRATPIPAKTPLCASKPS